MPKYLPTLWDDYSKIVLSNTKDIDARDEDYDEKVATKVWNTVSRLREKRVAFRNMIRAELRIAKRRGPPA